MLVKFRLLVGVRSAAPPVAIISRRLRCFPMEGEVRGVLVMVGVKKGGLQYPLRLERVVSAESREARRGRTDELVEEVVE